jgi:hypothetical protein
MNAALPLTVFTEWLAFGERGISSEAMVSQMTGRQIGRSYSGWDHPFDCDDFKRCEKLLRQVPLARVFLPQMAVRSVEWARLVAAWDEIVASIEDEAPGLFDGASGRGRGVPKSYALMKAVLSGSEVSS